MSKFKQAKYLLMGNETPYMDVENNEKVQICINENYN